MDLEWTPLMQAVANGTLAEVEAALSQGGSVEDRDRLGRTPWLLALRTGDIAKVKLLENWGADTNACAQGSRYPLAFALQGRSPEVLR